MQFFAGLASSVRPPAAAASRGPARAGAHQADRLAGGTDSDRNEVNGRTLARLVTQPTPKHLDFLRDPQAGEMLFALTHPVGPGGSRLRVFNLPALNYELTRRTVEDFREWSMQPGLRYVSDYVNTRSPGASGAFRGISACGIVISEEVDDTWDGGGGGGNIWSATDEPTAPKLVNCAVKGVARTFNLWGHRGETNGAELFLLVRKVDIGPGRQFFGLSPEQRYEPMAIEPAVDLDLTYAPPLPKGQQAPPGLQQQGPPKSKPKPPPKPQALPPKTPPKPPPKPPKGAGGGGAPPAKPPTPTPPPKPPKKGGGGGGAAPPTPPPSPPPTPPGDAAAAAAAAAAAGPGVLNSGDDMLAHFDPNEGPGPFFERIIEESEKGNHGFVRGQLKGLFQWRVDESTKVDTLVTSSEVASMFSNVSQATGLSAMDVPTPGYYAQLINNDLKILSIEQFVTQYADVAFMFAKSRLRRLMDEYRRLTGKDAEWFVPTTPTPGDAEPYAILGATTLVRDASGKQTEVEVTRDLLEQIAPLSTLDPFERKTLVSQVMQPIVEVFDYSSLVINQNALYRTAISFFKILKKVQTTTEKAAADVEKIIILQAGLNVDNIAKALYVVKEYLDYFNETTKRTDDSLTTIPLFSTILSRFEKVLLGMSNQPAGTYEFTYPRIPGRPFAPALAPEYRVAGSYLALVRDPLLAGSPLRLSMSAPEPGSAAYTGPPGYRDIKPSVLMNHLTRLRLTGVTLAELTGTVTELYPGDLEKQSDPANFTTIDLLTQAAKALSNTGYPGASALVPISPEDRNNRILLDDYFTEVSVQLITATKDFIDIYNVRSDWVDYILDMIDPEIKDLDFTIKPYGLLGNNATAPSKSHRLILTSLVRWLALFHIHVRALRRVIVRTSRSVSMSNVRKVMFQEYKKLSIDLDKITTDVADAWASFQSRLQNGGSLTRRVRMVVNARLRSPHCPVLFGAPLGANAHSSWRDDVDAVLEASDLVFPPEPLLTANIDRLFPMQVVPVALPPGCDAGDFERVAYYDDENGAKHRGLLLYVGRSMGQRSGGPRRVLTTEERRAPLSMQTVASMYGGPSSARDAGIGVEGLDELTLAGTRAVQYMKLLGHIDVAVRPGGLFSGTF